MTSSRISLAAAGVGLSEEFVARVHMRLPEPVRLALWVLREAVRCPDPVPAAENLQWVLDRAIRLAAEELGRPLTDEAVAAMRGCVVEAVLGERRACTLVPPEGQELSPLATAGIPPPVPIAGG